MLKVTQQCRMANDTYLLRDSRTFQFLMTELYCQTVTFALRTQLTKQQHVTVNTMKINE